MISVKFLINKAIIGQTFAKIELNGIKQRLFTSLDSQIPTPIYDTINISINDQAFRVTHMLTLATIGEESYL